MLEAAREQYQQAYDLLEQVNAEPEHLKTVTDLLAELDSATTASMEQTFVIPDEVK